MVALAVNRKLGTDVPQMAERRSRSAAQAGPFAGETGRV